MCQAQLRNFIPEMLKYSTGRSKPGWGKPECRPVWWPGDLPWANVRSDARTDEDKKRVRYWRHIEPHCSLHVLFAWPGVQPYTEWCVKLFSLYAPI